MATDINQYANSPVYGAPKVKPTGSTARGEQPIPSQRPAGKTVREVAPINSGK